MERSTIYKKYIKRFLDIFCSGLALVALCWLYAFIAVLVRIKLGSPVIFKQQRPGKINPKTGKEKLFFIYKFRTMTDEKDSSGNLLPDEIRLTKFGKMLRSTSMDELPEAINILKGDMSVVGPRPLLVSYLSYYTEEERKRHTVRPGLTGLAQVNGRNFLGWDDRLQLDIKYVRELSFSNDIRILIKTVKKVISKEDIAESTIESLEQVRKSKNNLIG